MSDKGNYVVIVDIDINLKQTERIINDQTKSKKAILKSYWKVTLNCSVNQERRLKKFQNVLYLQVHYLMEITNRLRS